MKYCKKCKKKFDTKNELCPNCGRKLHKMSQDDSNETNETEAAEIVSTMLYQNMKPFPTMKLTVLWMTQ